MTEMIRKEAFECYRDLADEVIIVGEDWPYEFEWSHIGKTFQKGYEKLPEIGLFE